MLRDLVASLLRPHKEARISLVLLLGYAIVTILAFTAATYSESLAMLVDAFELLHRLLRRVGRAVGKAVTSRRCAVHVPSGFAYGLQRLELLISFGCMCILVFACMSCIVEALRQLLVQHAIHPFFVEGICVAHMVLVGTDFVSSVEHDTLVAASDLKTAVAGGLVAAQQCLAPVACLLGTQLAVITGVHRIDELVAMLMVVIIIVSSIEPLQAMLAILVQRPPVHAKPALDRAVREANRIAGVLDAREVLFWSLTDAQLIGMLRFRLTSDADESCVLRSIQRLFAPLVTHCTIELERATSATSPWRPLDRPSPSSDKAPTIPNAGESPPVTPQAPFTIPMVPLFPLPPSGH